jgi:hypothetical protein
MDKDFKLANIKVNPNDWELFKRVAKLTGSNASVEIRKFIKQYLAEHTNEINQILKGGQK